MEQRAKMPEKQTFTTTTHLDQISSRDGDHIRGGVEERLRTLYTSRVENSHDMLFENVEQPEAERILGEIAELAKQAHGELGNITSTEAVWRRATNIATDRLFQLAETQQAETGANQALTVVVMDLLDNATRSRDDSDIDELDYLIEYGPPGIKHILGEAATCADHLGLVVSVENENLFSVGEEIRRALREHTQMLDDIQDEAIKIEFGQSSERNDQSLLKIAQEMRTMLDAELDKDWTILDFAYKEKWDKTYINNIIESGSFTDDSLETFLSAIREQLDRLNQEIENRGQQSIEYDLIVSEVLNKLPSERLRALYSESGGLVHEILRTQAENLDDEHRRLKRANNVVLAMSRIYNLNAVQLKWQISEEHPILGEIMESEEYDTIMLQSVMLMQRPKSPNTYPSREEYIQAARAYDSNVESWLRDYLHEQGIPNSLADEMRAASYGWTRTNRGEYYEPNPHTVAENALKIKYANNILCLHDLFNDGPIGLEKLREKTGIVNAYNYKKEQLERMLRFVDGDQETLRYLREGDVTVVFTDARGDYNGALTNTADNYEKPSGRTLFFEIHNASDIYRYSQLLRNLGIADSTRVIATHGGLGRMVFGAQDTSAIGTRDKVMNTEKDVKVGDSSGIRQMAREFMQDSRGIDDPKNVKGRRRIILDSCSQAVEYETFDGRPSRSTASEFARNIEQSNIDIYGASAEIASGRSGNELVYTSEGSPSKIRKLTVKSIQGMPYMDTQEVDSIELYQEQTT